MFITNSIIHDASLFSGNFEVKLHQTIKYKLILPLLWTTLKVVLLLDQSDKKQTTNF